MWIYALLMLGIYLIHDLFITLNCSFFHTSNKVINTVFAFFIFGVGYIVIYGIKKIPYIGKWIT